jgi:hypothetical protein
MFDVQSGVFSLDVGTTEQGKPTAAQLVSAIKIR